MNPPLPSSGEKESPIKIAKIQRGVYSIFRQAIKAEACTDVVGAGGAIFSAANSGEM
jgi:hypothetical protein